jgi:RNA polymerase sigma factor (sigma-70 family)
VDCDWEAEELYRRHNSALARSVVRRLQQRDDAADVVQSVFVKLLERLRVGSLNEPLPYLTRMSANEATSLSRSKRREAVVLERAADVPQMSLDPFPQLESRDLLRRIDDAVARLKPKTRMIFLAHRLDGLSYQQIADQVGMSVKGVEKQMSKAIAHIDRLLDRP